MNVTQGIMWALSVIVALFVGGYLKSYMGKKGERKALDEDLQLILREVREVTHTQEDIKKQISGRQRLWELKREIAYDILKTSGTLSHLFVVICSANQTVRDPNISDEYRSKLMNDLLGLNQRFQDSLEMFWQLEGTSQIVYDLRIAYRLQRLANAGAALHTVSLSPSKEEHDKARTDFINVRTEIIQVLQEQLKADV